MRDEENKYKKQGEEGDEMLKIYLYISYQVDLLYVYVVEDFAYFLASSKGTIPGVSANTYRYKYINKHIHMNRYNDNYNKNDNNNNQINNPCGSYKGDKGKDKDSGRYIKREYIYINI